MEEILVIIFSHILCAQNTNRMFDLTNFVGMTFVQKPIKACAVYSERLYD